MLRTLSCQVVVCEASACCAVALAVALRQRMLYQTSPCLASSCTITFVVSWCREAGTSFTSSCAAHTRSASRPTAILSVAAPRHACAGLRPTASAACARAFAAWHAKVVLRGRSSCQRDHWVATARHLCGARARRQCSCRSGCSTRCGNPCGDPCWGTTAGGLFASAGRPRRGLCTAAPEWPSVDVIHVMHWATASSLSTFSAHNFPVDHTAGCRGS